MAAWHCQGLALIWVASGAVAPLSAPPSWRPWWPPVGWLVPAASHAVRLASNPLDPPPR
jgi:hypothetical protein